MKSFELRGLQCTTVASSDEAFDPSAPLTIMRLDGVMISLVRAPLLAVHVKVIFETRRRWNLPGGHALGGVQSITPARVHVLEVRIQVVVESTSTCFPMQGNYRQAGVVPPPQYMV